MVPSGSTAGRPPDGCGPDGETGGPHSQRNLAAGRASSERLLKTEWQDEDYAH